LDFLKWRLLLVYYSCLLVLQRVVVTRQRSKTAVFSTQLRTVSACFFYLKLLNRQTDVDRDLRDEDESLEIEE
jgi:uncharacterized membrane protein YGL010W